ncbi:AraC family transcriptional regulator [Aequorivita sp. H23M31]|uniref:AraC family transcriptional regulator n=1 Tax=Aequorivita ciconiae TaxID=2494375 RepID=A0A410G106_9FLAO|nr:helix-turn-helix transcriptional regulator [Aequorivita sp. H23M31]QAA80931.1 AraC family transcriptional regulator [Aequorivita sp. H23M31]
MERTIHLLTEQVAFSFFRDYSHSDPKGREDPSLERFSEIFDYNEYYIDTRTDCRSNIQLNDDKGFFFLYSWEGNLVLRLNDCVKSILPYQSAIFLNADTAALIQIELENECQNHFCVISYKKPNGNLITSDTCFYNRCKDSLKDNLNEGPNLFIGQPYLKLLDKINELSCMSKDSWASKIIMQGTILQIFGLKMEQVIKSLSNGMKNDCLLTKTEIDRLQVISHNIKENPAVDYSIEYICRETGLSPSKLQDGFKKLHNRTVIDHIRQVRLERALELIETTDLNISEIVYSVGWTSRSYFSKIFKNKYKLSPKSYQEKVRSKLMADTLIELKLFESA